MFNKILNIALPLLILCLFSINPSLAQEHQAESSPVRSESVSIDSASADSMTVSQVETAAQEASQSEQHGETAAGQGEAHGESTGTHHGSNIGSKLPLWSILPFIGILLSIALFPLFAPQFWHHHYPKVSAFWAVLFAVPFLLAYGGDAFYEILHIYLIDYIPFIILLWGLFTVSGGILLRGNLKGTPPVNTLLILIGTLLASWMGTTGAAMLLIRPIIRANAGRTNKMHVIIFFIFLVANIGGSLTPLGDPPLFLGFIHGVPFFWTFNIMPHMIVMVIMLLILFFFMDTWMLKREKGPVFKEETKVPLKLEGYHNFLFLGGILAGVLLSGSWKPGEINILGVHVGIQNLTRDGIIILMGILSIVTTAKVTRRDNAFTWEPILEVAYLFAGIFMTIVPALALLKAGTSGKLAFIIEAVKEPWHYFWITGTLSSFLDNAPTYLTFFNTALGSLGLDEATVNQILTGAIHSPVGDEFTMLLKAISAGAVFFGANTYIGNAPNFMVRSIAEENHIKMPSFLGYMVWSVLILCPMFLLVTLIFF